MGRHCRIRRAIIDKDVKIPQDTTIGYDLEHDRRRGFTVTEQGVVVIAKAESPETFKKGVTSAACGLAFTWRPANAKPQAATKEIHMSEPTTPPPKKNNYIWLYYFAFLIIASIGVAAFMIWWNLSQQLTPKS